MTKPRRLITKSSLPAGRKTQLILALVACLSLADRAMGIGAGQVDDFETGTTMSWQEGVSSPNPPINVANGGPAGAGDAYLSNVSAGSFGPGTKMVMFNFAQWTGNYTATGTNRITAEMKNFGPAVLHMRITIQGSSGTIYSSSSASMLPVDGVWHPVTFDLTPTAMSNVSGIDSLATVLGNVAELRILSAAGGPSYPGDTVASTLGVDNIRAVSVATFTPRITGMAIVSNVPRVSFTTVVGQSYRVERKNSLIDPMWTVLPNATNVSGTGGVVQVDDTEPGAGNLPARFYRVAVL